MRQTSALAKARRLLMKRFLLILLSIGLVLTGCGKGNDHNSNAVITVADPDAAKDAINPTDFVFAAVKQTEALTSFKATITTRMTNLPLIGEFVQPATILQAANGDYAIKSNFADSAVNGGVSPFGLLNFAIEIRQIDNTIYILLPEEQMKQFADTKWISIDRDQIIGEELEYFDNLNPKTYLNFLLGGAKNTVVSEGEKIDSVSATHVSGQTTFEQLLKALDPEEQQEIFNSIFSNLALQNVSIDEMLSNLNDLNLEFDVWISQAGYVLRSNILAKDIDRLIDAIAPTLSNWTKLIEDVAMSFEIDFFDHGTPITIARPPLEEVTPYAGSLATLLA